MLVKLRFDQFWNEDSKFKKNQKNEKPAHIAFLWHIPKIIVDKHGVHTLKRHIHVCHVIPQISSQGWREVVWILEHQKIQKFVNGFIL